MDAYHKLLLLLGEANCVLRALGEEPVIVASCPARFNDVSNDVDWRAVRVGSFLSERQDYVERPEAHDKRLREGPENVRTANLVLERLEAGGWRDLHQLAFEREYVSPEEVIGLVLQNDEAWLVLCDSYNGKSAVYMLAKDIIPIGYYDGLAPFDRCLGELRPLTIRTNSHDEIPDHSISLSPTEVA